MNQLAILFPGQGAFQAGALGQARLVYHGVERMLLTIEAVAQRRLGRSLNAVMVHPAHTAETLLTSDPEILQLAIYATSVSMFEVIQAEGAADGALLMGHSFGEIAAMVCAGVFTVEQGAEIVCDRIAALASAAPRDGCMAAVAASPAQVREALAGFAAAAPGAVQIAVENHSGQTVVSGPRTEIAGFIETCAALQIPARRLNSPYAFHHSSLAAAAAEFAARLARHASVPPRYPIYSPILEREYSAADDFGASLARHLTLPVKFQSAVRRLQSKGVNIAVECGALDALCKIALRVAGPGNIRVFPACGKAGEELSNVRRIINHLREVATMNAKSTTQALQPDFEAYWRERGPIILGQLKSEFQKFVELLPAAQSMEAPAMPAMPLPMPLPAVAAISLPAPSQRVPRDRLFNELVAIYAQAMEYPHEVFSESVELEAELGIDSVKQTEIIQRISAQYRLPPLPANFRAGDFKAMGQIVDFVFAHQGEAAFALN